MKITDLKRVNKLKSEYDLLDGIVASHRISSIKCVSFMRVHEYELPRSKRLSQKITGAILGYMVEIRKELEDLGVEYEN
ncbi:MAG: hypothetical protein E7155_03495 [Streptococcus equinus]|nr:hypothetical protein [Streptococcus equinus]MBE6162614.1 hypothetical protein [Streptococcus equinus]